jgi:hypothetical protein
MGLGKRRVERLEDQIEEHFFLLAAIVGIFILAVLSMLLFWGS